MAVHFLPQEIEEALQTPIIGPKFIPSGEFTGISTDTRSIHANDLFIALKGERFDGHAFIAQAASSGASGAVIQKGCAREIPENLTVFEVEDTLRALGKLAQFHRRRFSFPIGAITGSNGKTTTKEMVRSILAVHGPSIATEGNLNNEIGVPRTLFRLEDGLTAAVVEMGMNHPGELSRLVSYAEPDCAAITCVGAAHLEGLKSIAAVAEAKGEIFRGLKDDALAIVNIDDPKIVTQAKKSGRKMLTFGLAHDADVRLAEVSTHGQGSISVTIRFRGRDWKTELAFLGEHNARNACCAFAMGTALGASPEECAEGLARASGWEHRLSMQELPFGGVLIDDCYNANPASMSAGLQTLASLASSRSASPAAAVLGDMLELGRDEAKFHRRLGKQAAEAGVQILVAVGPRSIDTWREFVASAPDRRAISIPDPSDLTEADQFLRKALGDNGIVLIKGSRGMKLERLVCSLVRSGLDSR